MAADRLRQWRALFVQFHVHLNETAQRTIQRLVVDASLIQKLRLTLLELKINDSLKREKMKGKRRIAIEILNRSFKSRSNLRLRALRIIFFSQKITAALRAAHSLGLKPQTASRTLKILSKFS